MSERPLCFVLMPFGIKKDPAGGPDIDFDRIFEQAIRPAIEHAGLEPIRADEERTGGIIHKAMFERLLLCDYAVADLTTANPNVYYELGVRHAARPATTLSIFSQHQPPPFDVNYLRALPYALGAGNRFGEAEATALRAGLEQRLRTLRELAVHDEVADSPIFQLLTDYKAPDIARLKTDVFRDTVRYSAEQKQQLARARRAHDADALRHFEANLESLDGVETGVLVDLLLSYRAVQAWDAMIALFDRLPRALQRQVMLREQYAFALNRSRRREDAIDVLNEILKEQGPSSETNSLLGRVYKDLWAESRAAGEKAKAAGYLNQAIKAYERGFEADWRDAFPGINTVTLLDIKGDAAALRRKAELLPVVRFAVSQRIKNGQPDYWDYATLVELAVLDDDAEAAQTCLADALAAVRETWEPQSTANNLRLIRDARRARGVEELWLDEIIEQLG